MLERRINVFDVRFGFDELVAHHMQHDFGHAAGLAVARALKDHVFHFRPAQVLHPLLAQNPGDGVGHIALATAIWADDRSYAFTCKNEVSIVRKGLEACDFEAFKLEHWCPSFDAGGDGHQNRLFAEAI